MGEAKAEVVIAEVVTTEVATVDGVDSGVAVTVEALMALGAFVVAEGWAEASRGATAETVAEESTEAFVALIRVGTLQRGS